MSETIKEKIQAPYKFTERETCAKFDQWALVELFGHQRIVGRVTEATLAGGSFIRVDVHHADGRFAFTRFYGPAAIYSMSPIDEKVALLLSAQQNVEPVKAYELPEMLPPGMPMPVMPGGGSSEPEDEEPDLDNEGNPLPS